MFTRRPEETGAKLQLEELRIWFLSYCPSLGGTATYQARHMQYLTSFGAKVSYLDQELAPTCSQIHPEGLKRINLHELPLWKSPFRAYFPLLSLHKEEQPHVIMLSNFGLLIKLFPLLLWLRLTSQTRLVQTLHSRTFFLSLKNLLMEFCASLAFFICSKVICVSYYTRHSWQLRYPWLGFAPMRVVQNGVATRAAQHRETAVVPRIGFVGRLSAEKDPQLFCEVARLSRKKGRPWEFHIFGEGVLLPALQVKYQDAVNFHGLEPVKSKLYTKMDILLITSLTENAPFALLEAKSLGVPCVSPSIGGIPEYVEDGVDGVLAPDRSPDALLKALDQAVEGLEMLQNGTLDRARLFEFSTSATNLWQQVLS